MSGGSGDGSTMCPLCRVTHRGLKHVFTTETAKAPPRRAAITPILPKTFVPKGQPVTAANYHPEMSALAGIPVYQTNVIATKPAADKVTPLSNRKRGRPQLSNTKLTPAEKQARYRAKKAGTNGE